MTTIAFSSGTWYMSPGVFLLHMARVNVYILLLRGLADMGRL
jgi:hypothetical protein